MKNIKYLLFFSTLIQFLIAFQTQSQDLIESTIIDEYLGEYTVGSQCNTYKCPETSFENDLDNSFKCPTKGNSGRIELIDKPKGIYQIKFDTYNPFSSNGIFKATFKQSDVTTNSIGFSYITINLDSNYQLLIEPCYLGSLTHQVCSKADKKELAVWKIKGNEACEDCAFTMTYLG